MIRQIEIYKRHIERKREENRKKLSQRKKKKESRRGGTDERLWLMNLIRAVLQTVSSVK